jgi:uncharacterized protein (TIGR00251 family)
VEEPSARLHLRVSPGSSRTEIAGRHGNAWKLRVAAPPENGRANDAVVELLAEHLQVPNRSVTLVSGHRGRDKVVLVEGLALEEAERRLENGKSR